jgi:hypothetical protein
MRANGTFGRVGYLFKAIIGLGLFDAESEREKARILAE